MLHLSMPWQVPLSVAQKITTNLLGAILATVATITIVLIWLAGEADHQAAASIERMVQRGLRENLNNIVRQVNDYSFWDAAYEAAVKNDADWLFENIGSSVTDSKTFTGIAIVTPGLAVQNAWQEPLESGAKLELFPADVLNDVQSLLKDKPAEPEQGQSFYRALGGSIVAYGAQRITAQLGEGGDAESAHYMVFAVELGSDGLATLGEQFLIDDFTIAPAGDAPVATSERLVTPIHGSDGATVGSLAWSAPRPASGLLLKASLPLAAVLLGFLYIAARVARRASRLADQLAAEKNAATVASQTDTMTGMLNRTGFQRVLASPEAVQAAAAGEFCTVYFDVNNFKAINDSMGHHAGDRLIGAITQRLRESLPQDAVLARVGGDEFVALGFGRQFTENLKQIADHAASELDGAYDIGGSSVHSSCSVGYAKAQGEAREPLDVVRRADMAMYHVKEARLTSAREYDVAMDVEMAAFHEIEVALRAAMANDEFTVVYQPILNLRTGAIEHVEALLRMNSAMLGPVPPDRFIPVAEKTGLIQEIGLHVLDCVCRDMAAWSGVTVSVNISPVQLLNTNFVGLAVDTVRRHGVSPQSIIFELTEGVLIDSPRNARVQLDALKAAGFSIFLDDFGSGFSSIGYLSQFPFDGVKIDKSLVQGSGDAAHTGTVLDSIIAMAGAMKLEVVAEGVETEEQRDVLMHSACGWLQGYLISRPLPVSAVSPFLADAQVNVLREAHAKMAAADHEAAPASARSATA